MGADLERRAPCRGRSEPCPDSTFRDFEKVKTVELFVSQTLPYAARVERSQGQGPGFQTGLCRHPRLPGPGSTDACYSMRTTVAVCMSMTT